MREAPFFTSRRIRHRQSLSRTQEHTLSLNPLSRGHLIRWGSNTPGEIQAYAGSLPLRPSFVLPRPIHFRQVYSNVFLYLRLMKGRCKVSGFHNKMVVLSSQPPVL